VSYLWGRFRGLAQELKRPPPSEALLGNIFFDTCVYHQTGIDPETGHYYDDTKRYIDATQVLTLTAKLDIYEHNARRIYPLKHEVRKLIKAWRSVSGTGIDDVIARSHGAFWRHRWHLNSRRSCQSAW